MVIINVTPDTILSCNSYSKEIDLLGCQISIRVDQDSDSPLTIDLESGDVFMTYFATYRDFVLGKTVDMLLPGDRYVVLDIPRDRNLHHPGKGVSINGKKPGDLYVFVKLALPKSCPEHILGREFSELSSVSSMFLLS